MDKTAVSVAVFIEVTTNRLGFDCDLFLIVKKAGSGKVVPEQLFLKIKSAISFSIPSLPAKI